MYLFYAVLFFIKKDATVNDEPEADTRFMYNFCCSARLKLIENEYAQLLFLQSSKGNV